MRDVRYNEKRVGGEPLDQNFLEQLEREINKPPCPPCLKCGWCCKHTVCYYGEWDYERGRCRFLSDQNLCTKFEDITRYEETIGLNPGLFGSGCCLNYTNPDRLRKLRDVGGIEEEWL